MPSPSATPTPVTPPRVPLIDQRTGLIDRAWYMFFLSLFRAAQTADDPSLGPSPESLIASYDAALQALAQEVGTQPQQAGELQQQIDALRQEVQTQPQPELGSMAPLEQDNIPWLTFNNAPSPTPTAVGSVYWDGGTTLNSQATTNVTMRLGESEFIYVKASSAITKGQLCYHTGAVGASGVVTAAPTTLNMTYPPDILGVAAESIALNGFGLIQISGLLRGFNTSGSSVGEVWADGDPLYYNPSFVGSMTKTKPSAPSQKTYIGEVVNAGAGSSGSMSVRIVFGSILGDTDSNVQFTSLANGDLIQYDSTATYWKNVTAASVIAGAGGAPVTKTADFTVAASETFVINNKSGSTCTATLPTASTNTGRTLVFQNYQAQSLVSASSNVVPQGGGAAGTAILTNVAGNWARLVSDGTNWIIMEAAAYNNLLLE